MYVFYAKYISIQLLKKYLGFCKMFKDMLYKSGQFITGAPKKPFVTCHESSPDVGTYGLCISSVFNINMYLKSFIKSGFWYKQSSELLKLHHGNISLNRLPCGKHSHNNHWWNLEECWCIEIHFENHILDFKFCWRSFQIRC